MYKYKQFRVLLLILILSGIVIGCNVNSYQKSIYNDNSKIVKIADSYSFTNRIGSTKKNEANIQFRTFNGTQTIWNIEAKEEGFISVKYESRIDNGDFKTVLLTPDEEVTKIFENSGSGNSKLKVQKGKNRIKIVGYDAKGEVALFIKLDGAMKIHDTKN